MDGGSIATTSADRVAEAFRHGRSAATRRDG
jgi:hypothetical protein